MIDDYLNSFMQEEEDELVATIAKKFIRRMPFNQDSETIENSLNYVTEN